MAEGRIVKPVAATIAIVVVLLVVTALLGVVAGPTAEAPDGERISGQSPAQFQPAAVDRGVDPETGEIAVDGAGDGRILVDLRHDNRVGEVELARIVDAAFGAGHDVDFADENGPDYDERLAGYNGLLVVDPEDPFTGEEIDAISEFTDAGGHVVVLAEPTQLTGGGVGLFSAGPSEVSFGANNLTEAYGMRIGAELLYNVDASRNDNNFMSIYAAPEDDGPLTDDVETVQFDSGGYVVVSGASDAEPVFAALEGTRTMDSRRSGTYPTVARSDNVVVVADASFIAESEVYDVDNEVFVGNLLEFLADGNATESLGSP